MADSVVHQELVSHLTLRRIVGLLGICLPPLLIVGCLVLGSESILQDSISDYYATVMRNVLVGVLFTIGWFFFTYRGYERRDDVAGDIACVAMLCVALFPATSQTAAIRAVHFAAATTLFSVLAYFSIALFTKTNPGMEMTPEKQLRNRIYVACGVVMIGCIAAIGLFYVFLRDTSVRALRPVFWFEAIALWAFGWSWLVKGEWLFKDANPTKVRRST